MQGCAACVCTVQTSRIYPHAYFPPPCHAMLFCASCARRVYPPRCIYPWTRRANARYLRACAYSPVCIPLCIPAILFFLRLRPQVGKYSSSLQRIVKFTRSPAAISRKSPQKRAQKRTQTSLHNSHISRRNSIRNSLVFLALWEVHDLAYTPPSHRHPPILPANFP